MRMQLPRTRVVGRLAALLGGSCLILGAFGMTAAAAGGGNGSQKTQSVSFTSSAPATEAVGATYMPRAMASSGLRPLSYVIDGSSTPGACTITGTAGPVLFHNIPGGMCIIDAYQAGDPTPANHGGRSYLPSWLVAVPSQTILVAKAK
jgi:hypothetical protein